MKRSAKSALYLLLGMLVASVVGENAQAQGDGLNLISDPQGRVIVDQSYIAEQSGNGFAQVPIGPRLRSYSQFGNGFGWRDGHTFANIFYPMHLNPGVDLIFLDVRGFVSYDEVGERSGGNVGLGYRRYIDSMNTMVGVSVWGDADGAQQQNFFQAGASLEVIYNNLEMRLNGYLAEGDGTKRILNNAILGGPYYQSHRILVNRATVADVQYDGFDGEVGGPLPGLQTIGAHGYVGGYWMHNDNFGEFGGVKVRGQIYMHEDVQFGIEYRRDDKFGSSTWGNVMVQLPNQPWRVWWRQLFQPRGKAQQLSRQVERHYRIPVRREIVNTPTLLINPIDGLPYFVHHVDPNATTSNGQPGTIENPFRTLEAARLANNGNVDIIRVVANANLTTPNGALAVTAPFDLLRDQRLLSTAVNHTFMSQIGTAALPEFTGGPLPLINNMTAGSSVVRLARSNTEVSGFVIDGRDSTGAITNSGITSIAGFSNYNINRNTFQNFVSGVDLTEIGGTGRFDSNMVLGTAGTSAFGYRVQNSSGTLNATITNSQIQDTQTGVAFIGTGTARINAPVISSNSIFNNTSNNILFDFSGSASGGFSIANNPLIGGSGAVAGNAVLINLAGNSTLLTSNITSNTIESAIAGIVLRSTNNAVVQPLTISGNTIRNLSGIGVDVIATGSSTIQNLTINGNNSIVSVLDAGIRVDIRNSATLRQMLIQQNTISGVLNDLTTNAVDSPGGDGIYLVRRDSARFGAVGAGGPFNGLGDIVIGNNTIIGQTGLGNSISNNAGDGIRLFGTGSGNVTNTLLYDGNTLQNNQNGFRSQLFGNAIFTVQNDANVYDANRDHGVIVTTADSAVFNGTFLADTFTGHDANNDGLGDAFFFLTNNFSRQTVLIGGIGNTRRTTITGGINGVRIVNFSNPGAGVSTWTVRGTDIESVSNDGITLDTSSVVGATLNIGGQGLNENTNISNSGDDGISAVLRTGINRINVLGHGTISPTIIAGSGRITGRSSLDANADTFVDDNTRGDGIRILELDGTTTLQLAGARTTGNAGRGVDIDARSETAGASTFNLGRFTPGNSLNNARDISSFSNNQLQGVVVTTTTNNNTGVFLNDTDSVADPAAVGNFYHHINNATDQGNAPIIQVVANVTIENANIQNNGAPGTSADGLVLDVGSNTRINAFINTINPNSAAGTGGNAGADIALVTHVSQEMNRPSVNGAPIDNVALDAVGQINLVFGVVDTNNDGIADSRTSGAENRGIRGVSFRVATQGSATPVAGSVIDGLYNTADVFKPANRSAFMRVTVFGVPAALQAGGTGPIPSSIIDPSSGVTPPPNTTVGNVFFNAGTNVLANVDALFANTFNQNTLNNQAPGVGSRTILFNNTTDFRTLNGFGAID